MRWALSIKSALGNVYHLKAYHNPPRAYCNSRVRLQERAYETPPDDGYLCGRCQTIERSLRRRNLLPPLTSPSDGAAS